MPSQSPLLEQLIEALRCLPGVGRKSAQRMTYHLLERDRQGARLLAQRLLDAVERIGRCEQCRTLTEETRCGICSDARRDQTQLCVVESPADVQIIEQAAIYKGRYFVLLGSLSPLDGIGPKEVGLDLLEAQLAGGGISEIILATGATVEGEATAHYISEMAAKHAIQATRIAHGVPMGGELHYVDERTLMHAFSGRQVIDGS